MTLLQQVRESVTYIESKLGAGFTCPKAVVICGSGLGTLASALENAIEIPYSEIPHFEVSTVQGHASKLVYGALHGQPILAMVGRFHFYEGYTMKQTTYPVRVFKHLGIKVLIATNAAGGLNPAYKVGFGDFMVIADHINMPGLCGQSPLIGKNEADFGERFTPLSDAYDLRLRQVFHQIAEADKLGRQVHEGVYCFVSGPTYETRAECRMLRQMGADVVGMSTVPEVLVARHSGLRTLALSLVTNECVQDRVPSGKTATLTHEAMTAGMANHEEVVKAGRAAAQDMQKIIGKLIAEL